MTETGEDSPVEPPPEGRAPFSGMTLGLVPFGSPPPEPVTLQGEIPWELREADPLADD